MPDAHQPILDKQSQLNRSTRRQWHLYASHRQEIEKLLVPARPGGRICVLGAGNCNDLDLTWLTQVYDEVCLADIDADALTEAAKFQKVDTSPKLKCQAPIDLTGLADRISRWPKSLPLADELSTCIQLAGEPPEKTVADLGGPFDVVLSPCVLSQLLAPLRDILTESHPSFVPLLSAIRGRHLRTLSQLVGPGGRGVFVCDLFSTGSLPDLARVPSTELPGLMRKRLGLGKFFSGLDPASIKSVLTRDRSIDHIRPAGPWLWHLSLAKTYLVYAISFTKS